MERQVLGKLRQLEAQNAPTPELKDRLKSYLMHLSQDREKYVRESKQQIATLPETLRQQHPEGGLHVALGVAATTSAFAEHIKASALLLALREF